MFGVCKARDLGSGLPSRLGKYRGGKGAPGLKKKSKDGPWKHLVQRSVDSKKKEKLACRGPKRRECGNL